MIHPTAIIAAGAVVDPTVEIGPYAIVDERVRVGPRCRVGPHAHLTGDTVIGARNVFHTGCVIGDAPQDLKYRGRTHALAHRGRQRLPGVRHGAPLQPGR